MRRRPLSRRAFLGSTLLAPVAANWTRFASAAQGSRGGRYRIESIELYTRLTPPPRMEFAIGKQKPGGGPKKPLTNPIGHVRMILSDADGNRTFGCSGERLSVRWLDKRPNRPRHLKLCELVALIEKARDVYLASASFDSPFDQWLSCYKEIHRAGTAAGQVDLVSAFASSLMERAMLDGVCRLAGKSLFEMVREDRLGAKPEAVHPELKGIQTTDYVCAQPVTCSDIRHCIGLTDPLTDGDLPAENRINDGLPETLEEYIAHDGLTHFKIKIEGTPKRDFPRLKRIAEILPKGPDVLITMDANEMFKKIEIFEEFVGRIRRELPDLFQRLAWFEQPMPRAMSLDPKAAPGVRRIGKQIPLTIDEGDGTLDAFKRAHAIGYSGTSHKNCKGFFKSLLNRALVAHYNSQGDKTFMSGEDLTCLPIVPLHEDLVSQSILGITHGDRNGHHYHYGLSSLSATEKKQIAKHHPSMYVFRDGEWFLDIQFGRINTESLQCPGFGVAEEPDWKSMYTMRRWLAKRDKDN